MQLILEYSDDATHVEICDDSIELLTDIRQGEPGSVDDLFKQNWIRFLEDSEFWQQLDAIDSIDLTALTDPTVTIEDKFNALISVVSAQSDFANFMKSFRNRALEHVLNLRHF